ncbi:hypothetical protein ABIC65_003741 [Sphingomonas trueperi]|uniref:ankyrin repeat domain-containing protein n=1 Tax=Sphingomonas trueperi TaxID=53317 RepID=UPI00339B2F0A
MDLLQCVYLAMLNFFDRFNDLKVRVPRSLINISESKSHGIALACADHFEIFIYSSTFYFDIEIHSEIISADVAFAVAQFDLQKGLIGAVRVEMLGEDGVHFKEVLPLRRLSPLCNYSEKVKLALPLRESKNSINRTIFRVWVYNDIVEPFHFAIKNVYFVIDRAHADLSVQMNDFIIPCNDLGWQDGLKPLIDAGWTSMHFMAHWGYIDFIRHLIFNGADPDVSERNGSTPLHRAAESGNVGIATLLLEAGAKINPVDKGRLETPLDCAIRNNHRDVIDILACRGGRRSVDLQIDKNAVFS